MSLRSTLSLLALLIAVPAAAQWQEFTDGEYGLTFRIPADWTISTPDPDPIAIYDLPILKYYAMSAPTDSMALRLYFLDNPAETPLVSFLTVPRAGSVIVITRHVEVVGGLNILQVGYEYDPPVFGGIAVEVENLIERTPAIFAYLQLAAAPGQDYAGLLDELIGSIAETVATEVRSFGSAKLEYR